MNRLLILTICLVWAVAHADSTCFPYETELVVRHEQSAQLRVGGQEPIPQVSAMPATDSVVSSSFVSHVGVIPADRWTETAEAIDKQRGAPQGALTIVETPSGNVWKGFAEGAWIDLEGVPAEPGEWTVCIDIDHTTVPRSVRYRVGVGKDAVEFTTLTKVGTSAEWMPIGNPNKDSVTSVQVYGHGRLASAVLKSGARSASAVIEKAERYDLYGTEFGLDVTVGDSWGVDTLTVNLKNGDGETVKTSSSAVQDGVNAVDFNGLEPGTYTYEVVLTGAFKGKDLSWSPGAVKVTVPQESPAPKDNIIELTGNSVADLSSDEFAVGGEYSVTRSAGEGYLRWKDSTSGTGKYAVMQGGKLIVKQGFVRNQPLDSFSSYVLGLNPEEGLDKPAAVVKPGGIQSKDGITVHVPNVQKDKLPDSGVSIVFQMQRSDDCGEHWQNVEGEGGRTGVGGSLVIPFGESGVLYRVNTVLE